MDLNKKLCCHKLFVFFLGGTKNETISRDEMNGSSDDVSLQGLTNGCNVYEGLSGFATSLPFVLDPSPLCLLD